jgi:hypothetical protein
MKRARLTEEEIAEIEAVNREQATNLDAAMNKMRAGVPGAAGVTLATDAPKLAEKVETIDIPVFRKDAPVAYPAEGVAIPGRSNGVAKRPGNDGGTAVRSLRFSIDDDVPIPEASPHGASYPWARLTVGQSFFIPEDGRKHRGKLTSMYAAHKRYPGRRFRALWQDKDEKRGISGFRVWRVA